MPIHIKTPQTIEAAGNKPKVIREFLGRVNTRTSEISLAHMLSPQGWEEPGQCPEFHEYTLVLKGKLKVESKDGSMVVGAGEAVWARPGEWVRYSTPDTGGAEYIAVCLPAFSPDQVHRDPV